MLGRTRQLHYFLALAFAVAAGVRVLEMKVDEYPFAILMVLGNVALAVSQWLPHDSSLVSTVAAGDQKPRLPSSAAC